jgi:predicted ABC-type ATPase
VVKHQGRIIVAAGTNGAGKSSIAGEFFNANGGAYFNPDLRTRELIAAGFSEEEANARSWHEGFERLRDVIASNEDYVFETTLGGQSITRELHRAIAAGQSVCIWYVGLDSPELHIARVKARVKRGGHDIPEGKIRERYFKSLTNLISFIGIADEIHVFDNSAESSDGLPQARLVMRMRGNRMVEPSVDDLVLNTPEWAKPVVAAALQAAAKPPRRPRKGKQQAGGLSGATSNARKR